MSMNTAVGNTARTERQPEILYIDRDLLVVRKPAGIASQPGPGCKEDLISLTAALLQERGEGSSLYLVHRLDLVVGGLVVLARTDSAAAVLSGAVSQKDGFVKGYYAVAEGNVTPPAATLTDNLRHDTLRGRAVVCRPGTGGKRAQLSYRVLAEGATESGRPVTALSVRLLTGRFHQIRAQLANAGFPLVGDGKYGARTAAEFPALFAGYLSFCHPSDGRRLTFSAAPPSAFPFSVFSENIYTPLFFEEK